MTTTRASVATEHRVLLVLLGLGLAHAFDDALLHRQPGVPATQHLWALGAVTLMATSAALVFGRLRPGLRGGVALAAGAATLTNGLMHVIHVATVEPGASDATGVVAFLVGLGLVALAAWIPWAHRRERATTTARRWARRLFALVAGVVVLQMALVPVVVAVVQTHKFRVAVGAPPSGDFRAVSFESTDGLRLSGWYRPSANRAAILVVNSAAGDRTGSVEHAELLAEHGYGVLLYDARGTGESEGSPNGWGWDWDRDVEGALGFLRGQPDLDPDRIGALGLSTGADVLLEVAAHDHRLAAVVTDGATGRSFADRPGGVAEAPFFWTMFSAARLFSGSSPGAPLRELVAHISPTPALLIASGSLPGELEANKRYAEAAGEPASLWTLPRVDHTDGIHAVAADYERRVVGQFDGALLP